MNPTLEQQVAALAPWYHDIPLRDGVRTVGWEGIRHVWEHIRAVRKKIDPLYGKALVLDLGSRDGMWSFEAESMGAREVVALELGVLGLLDRMLFCRAIRQSRVIPCYGADAERVDDFTAQFVKEYGLFDVVQHLGLLYHLKNPMRSLESCRKVMKSGAVLLLETAGASDARPVMLSNLRSSVYVDEWTYWAPTSECLIYMLGQSGFEVYPETLSVLTDAVPRIALVAKAV